MTSPSAVTESEESVESVLSPGCRGNKRSSGQTSGKYVARANMEPCFHQSETRLQEEFWITGRINQIPCHVVGWPNTPRITAIEIRPTAIEIHGSFLMQKFAKQLAKCICQCKIWTNFVVISFAVAWQLCSEGVLSGGLFTRSRLNYFVQKIRRNVQMKTAQAAVRVIKTRPAICP